ncbi:unnamed protein product [Hermetia illucens]|uniref:ATP-dependent DNA helicase n=1 Tax=Hermetia illucens TaxID=343691 RepID=A0A7R8YQX7_HERIL|nr:unnamed protein product [Hermetia illucens]
MCLALCASHYTYSKYSRNKKRSEFADYKEDKISYSGNWVKLTSGLGYIRRRKKAKVIRFCRFSLAETSEEFYHEQLMLYYSWRNEYQELLDSNLDLRAKFENCSAAIKSASFLFNQLGGDWQFNLVLEIVREADDEANRAEIPNIGNEPLHDFEYDEQVGDVMEDLIPGPSVLSAEEFQEMTRSLNLDQRDFLQHVTYFFETASASTPPMRTFISGGAGVGKSVLTKAIYHKVSHAFNKEPGCNPDDIRILLCAPTGKAAFGIRGQTIYSAFALPVSQASYSMPNLSASVSNTLASNLAKLKLIIIDEISMVGAHTFHRKNQRLQKMFSTRDYFDAVSVIVVRDFRQLPPVGDNWIL